MKRLRSDFTDAQAELSLRCVHTQFCDFSSERLCSVRRAKLERSVPFMENIVVLNEGVMKRLKGLNYTIES